jgi:hypothetical protein
MPAMMRAFSPGHGSASSVSANSRRHKNRRAKPDDTVSIDWRIALKHRRYKPRMAEQFLPDAESNLRAGQFIADMGGLDCEARAQIFFDRLSPANGTPAFVHRQFDLSE